MSNPSLDLGTPKKLTVQFAVIAARREKIRWVLNLRTINDSDPPLMNHALNRSRANWADPKFSLAITLSERRVSQGAGGPGRITSSLMIRLGLRPSSSGGIRDPRRLPPPAPGGIIEARLLPVGVTSLITSIVGVSCAWPRLSCGVWISGSFGYTNQQPVNFTLFPSFFLVLFFFFVSCNFFGKKIFFFSTELRICARDDRATINASHRFACCD